MKVLIDISLPVNIMSFFIHWKKITYPTFLRNLYTLLSPKSYFIQRFFQKFQPNSPLKNRLNFFHQGLIEQISNFRRPFKNEFLV